MVNMVLGPSSPPLSFPGRKKKGFPINGSVDFDVLAQARASRAIQRAQAAQFREAARELWDFRKS